MMKAFDIHTRIVQDYTEYLKSFIDIKNVRIREKVEEEFRKRRFLPEGMVQFNPAYALGQSLEELEREGVIGGGLREIFGSYQLYHHQVDALRRGAVGESFVVTSGTGSGKSLTYLATIFDAVLKGGSRGGLQAVIVYPMNALINSQEEEIKKYEINWLRAKIGERAAQAGKGGSLDEEIAQLQALTTARFPVRYGKYTGQESNAQRERFKDEQPHILLTNYMMLELIMTRNGERWLRDAMQESLRYLVFDELHTYRGRQGADVAMLVRRIKAHCGRGLICIGTSATMTTDGSAAERRAAVANVATQLFSQPFAPSQVVEERLRRTTAADRPTPTGFDLQEAVGQMIDPVASHHVFLQHPLAVWLEQHVALRVQEDGTLERGKPCSLREMAELLSQHSGDPVDGCLRALQDLLQWAEHLNREAAMQGLRQSFLPFKIHQFISQLSNVYVSLEPKEKRHITLEMGRFMKGPDGERPIFPVLFSRLSGYDFLCVRKRDGMLVPREPDDLPERIRRSELKGDRATGRSRRQLTEDDFPDGYLILAEEGDVVWDEADAENLPDNWFVKRKGEHVLDPYFEHFVPRKVYFDAQGSYSHEPRNGWAEGWFVPARLLFDPTSGQLFDGRTREFNKLMRLSNEGRSTATTILSFSTIKALNGNGIPQRNQKLLSFTDNRQDASLQAGHFNDFLMLARLRSTVYHALKGAEGHALGFDELPTQVLRKLDLPEEEYAYEPSQDPAHPNEKNRAALKEYLAIRLLYDLRRGWRNNTPNLEQCALLEIGYEGLGELCHDDAQFRDLEVFDKLSPNDRQRYLTQILNYFRTSYAFQYPKFEGNELEDMADRMHGRLDPDKLWSLDKDERIEEPFVMVTNKVEAQRGRVVAKSIGPLSAMAKYLRRIFKWHGSKTELKGDQYVQYIEGLCQVLTRKGILWRKPAPGQPTPGGEAPTYRLLISKVIWRLSPDRKVLPDEVRIASIRPIEPKANDFFRKLYQQDFSDYGRTLVGREHTGQLNHGQRAQREADFRTGKIAALYCSPTMELGIDIHELNVVHMRNVPPNPANYAQRSGRAGRSGQGALIFTYCAQRSPHDQHYFKRSASMVSGQVLPPKIDLCNEELIRTHFYAYVLMELGIRDMVTSVSEVLDMEDLPALPIKRDLLAFLEGQLEAFGDGWVARFGQVLELIPHLADTNWYDGEWLRRQVRDWLPRLDRSFDRWRSMFLSANEMVVKGRATQDDTSNKGDSPKVREARINEREGKRRKAILLNDSNRSYGADSEFYVYRYLAAEGFLPGYGFTRLPIRAFLGNRHQDQGEFVSRPRFIALREFGPHNLIYHNGGKYVIHKMNASLMEENRLHTIKICKQSGYALMGEHAKGVNNDPITKAPLAGQDAVIEFRDLLPLEESSARPRERISCEEEERQSSGYQIDQYFAFGRDLKGTRQVEICEGKEPLLNLIYDQAAQLIQVNSGWREAREKRGFHIDKESGRWKLAEAEKNADPEEKPQFVRLYTTDTSDILYLQPMEALGLDVAGTTTLAYALKRAIERKFQVEEREVMVWVMGMGDHRNILLYEAAEGSLGILSQLSENGQELKAVFAEACAVLHFDSQTGEDLEPDLPRATYGDLLSYYNQRDHDLLDRGLVRDALVRLMRCEVAPHAGARSRDDQYAHLLATFDPNSGTERKFLEYLYTNGYALPDRAQYLLPECYASADFVYHGVGGQTLVFCDGSVHDLPEVKAADARKRACARDNYDIVEWHHSEPLESLVARRKDIFRKIK